MKTTLLATDSTKQLWLSLLLSILCSFIINAQDDKTAYQQKKLFSSKEVLPIKLTYSNKQLKSKTTDSIYLKTDLSYQQENGTWKTVAVDLRARGNFRKANCYYTPVKMKIKKVNALGTLFEGNKKLKLVLPCFSCKGMNDFVAKEYLAYKLYEKIAPYHFKTRLVSIDFTEIKKNKVVSHTLLGILIEDIKEVAARHKGHVFKRHMQPITQDPVTSVQNSLFQFMIANTDYSTTYQHNHKQLFADKKILPVPYDFDMSGFVDTDYAVVSKVQNKKLPIEDVTERYYKGFLRDKGIFQSVRSEFLINKEALFAILDTHKHLFKNKREFFKSRDFISSFYHIIENDRRFENNIFEKARTVRTKKATSK